MEHTSLAARLGALAPATAPAEGPDPVLEALAELSARIGRLETAIGSLSGRVDEVSDQLGTRIDDAAVAVADVVLRGPSRA